MTSQSTKDILDKARSCHASGDNATAIELIRSVIQEDPKNAVAYNNLGLLLCEFGKFQDAVDHFRKSISLNPGIAEVYYNCANALMSLGNPQEAAGLFSKAIEVKEGLYDAHRGLGTALQALGDLAGAKTKFCECLKIRPDDALTHFRLGTIMRAWNMLDLAAGCYRNAIKFTTDNTSALLNLGETLQAAGEIDESEKVLVELVTREPENHLAHSNLLLSMSYNPAYSPAQIYNAHVKWGARFDRQDRSLEEFRNTPDPDRKLRVGYLSSDFCRHPAASFLEPVLKNHDRTKFTVICYSQGKENDEKTNDFRRYADDWREITPLADGEAKRQIIQDAVDILIDCTGHMADNRLPLFALKCAPIQISWIGYPNTTGLKSMDYRFTDTIVDPVDDSCRYTEKLVRLTSGFCTWEPPAEAPSVSELPAAKNGFVTFGSLHTMARLNEKVIGLWSRVLSAISGSRLVIFRNTLDATIINRLSSWFTRNGVDLNRIAFQREIPPKGHLAMHHEIDVALDTFPWSGHTTACEALWMGVPVITLRGERPAGRMVTSVLSQVGMREWIAETPEQFIEFASGSSKNFDRLSVIRKGLREKVQRSRLCDGTGCARGVEKALQEIWRDWCREH